MKKITSFVVIVAILLTAACATDDPHKRAKTGAGIGAVIGAVLGHQANGKSGKYVGAAAGAIAGAAVGNYQDKQQAELEKQLANEKERNELSITRMSDGSLRVGIASDVSFDVNSSEIKFNARNTFEKIAGVLKDYDATIIHVVGHTDSDGTDQYNQGLSERRADAVANLLATNGVATARIRSEGRGEREPIASNKTVDGKRKNRRVDIVIKPVVEGHEQEAESPPPNLGS